MPTTPADSSKPRDRRKAPRIAADLPFQLQARDALAEARLKDISSLGLCCRFQEPVPEMTLVGLRLELDPEHPIHAKGAVVRCEKNPADDGYEVAVYFTELEGESRTHLDRWLSARL